MICPKCNSQIPDDGVCPNCNPEQYNPFVSLGDLTEDDSKPNESDTISTVETVTIPPPQNGVFFSELGDLSDNDSNFEISSDNNQIKPKTKLPVAWKRWSLVAACCVLAVVALLCVNWKALTSPSDNIDDNVNNVDNNADSPSNREPLSDSCDYVLCSGVDTSGNEYELVANQTETALGYEITVGVIKNNEWLYPLSADFPFLGEDGLFHVTVSLAGESGTSLSTPNTVRKNLYFIDSGAFLMECHTEAESWFATSGHSLIIFSCHSLKSYTIDCKESTLLFGYSEAEFYSGDVISYGKIYTDNGKILLYSEVSGTSSGWTEDQVFDWCTFDPKTFDVTTFAKNVEGIRPESILSEGLIFASDKCFYNTKMEKVIDLSEYYIDMFYGGDIYFQNGECTFKTKNTLGTQFLITIDKSGKVLSEVEQ